MFQSEPEPGLARDRVGRRPHSNSQRTLTSTGTALSSQLPSITRMAFVPASCCSLCCKHSVGCTGRFVILGEALPRGSLGPQKGWAQGRTMEQGLIDWGQGDRVSGRCCPCWRKFAQGVPQKGVSEGLLLGDITPESSKKLLLSIYNDNTESQNDRGLTSRYTAIKSHAWIQTPIHQPPKSVHLLNHSFICSSKNIH